MTLTRDNHIRKDFDISMSNFRAKAYKVMKHCLIRLKMSCWISFK